MIGLERNDLPTRRFTPVGLCKGFVPIDELPQAIRRVSADIAALVFLPIANGGLAIQGLLLKEDSDGAKQEGERT